MLNKILTGSVSSIGNTALQLTRQPIGTAKIYIKAFPTNTAPIYIGTSTVTYATADATDGLVLSASEGVYIEFTDPTTLYVVSSGTGQKASFLIVY